MCVPPVRAELASRDDVSNVLVVASSGEPAGGEVCASLLWPPDAGTVSVIGVATATSPDGWAETALDRLDRRPVRVCIVGVDEQARSSTARPAASPDGARSVRWAAGPGNLTAVGVRVTECVEAVGDAAELTTLCVESLSPLLAATETRTAFQFLHTLTSLTTAKDVLAHYHVDPADTDERALGLVMSLFDAVVERDADGDFAVRTR